MNRRILKKRAKRFMESFTREKIPAAFTSEEERRQYVSAFARQYVGQAAHFPETAKEAQHDGRRQQWMSERKSTVFQPQTATPSS